MLTTSTFIQASAGPGGAAASVATISNGSKGHDLHHLISKYGEKIERDEARAEQVGKTEKPRTRAERADEATARRVAYFEKKAARYMAALNKLTGGRGHSSKVVLVASVQGGTGTAISASAPVIEKLETGDGNDAVVAKGHRISEVVTGGGQDAVALHGKRVEDVQTGQGGDAIAIQGRQVDSVYSGEGADAIAIQAALVSSVYAGEGSDSVSIVAGIAGGIYGDAGADAITVNARLGESVARNLAYAAREGSSSLEQAARLTGDVETRYRAALSNIADVNGGAGNDAITVTGAEAINIAGGTGDDLISVSGRTIGLHYGLGDGDDVVQIGAGTDVVLQLGARPDGTADPGDYTVTREGDRMVVAFAEGSITFTGMDRAGMVAIMAQGDEKPAFLNAPMPVDTTV